MFPNKYSISHQARIVSHCSSFRKSLLSTNTTLYPSGSVVAQILVPMPGISNASLVIVPPFFLMSSQVLKTSSELMAT
jgi:hypothetical protein